MDQQKIIESLNNEFEDFLKFCKGNSISEKDINRICSSLNYQLDLRQWKKVGLLAGLSFLCIWLCLNVDFLEWSISAVGRILMIKLLPIYDWTNLYNANCLVSYQTEDLQQVGASSNEDSEEINKRNCALCENLDYVDDIPDATFHYVEEQYLEKGHPVIITDSHSPIAFEALIHKITSDESYIETDPCDVESSFMLKRFANLDDFLRKARSANRNESWFFHLRNCQFEGVKSSRKFIPKPQYYATHLAPFYSSWLLMSFGIEASEKTLFMEGLVAVMQMCGELEIVLTAKNPCLDMCGQHRIILNEGEALVYLTDLWKFSYILNNRDHSSTVITETKWD